MKITLWIDKLLLYWRFRPTSGTSLLNCLIQVKTQPETLTDWSVIIDVSTAPHKRPFHQYIRVLLSGHPETSFPTLTWSLNPLPETTTQALLSCHCVCLQRSPLQLHLKYGLRLKYGSFHLDTYKTGAVKRDGTFPSVVRFFLIFATSKNTRK